MQGGFPGQRLLKPTLRGAPGPTRGQMSTQSVPNLYQMSSIEPPADYPGSILGSNPNLGSNIGSNSTRTESLQRRRSMSHHEMSQEHHRRVLSQPVYNTIQTFPKMIQVRKFQFVKIDFT